MKPIGPTILDVLIVGFTKQKVKARYYTEENKNDTITMAITIQALASM